MNKKQQQVHKKIEQSLKKSVKRVVDPIKIQAKPKSETWVNQETGWSKV